MRKLALMILFAVTGVALALAIGGCMGGSGYIRGDGVAMDDQALGDYCARNPTSPLCSKGKAQVRTP